MKTKHLICSAVLTAASLTVLNSCEDQGTGAAAASQPAGQGTEAPEPPKPEPPTGEEVAAQLMQQLEESPLATPGEWELTEAELQPDGSFAVAARLTLTVNEDIFTRENAPAAFNDERKAANEGINNAMLPESGYLIQVGAPTDIITEEDRTAKPLPENLQQLANELKQLAEASVYRKTTDAGQTVTVHATFKATEAPATTESPAAGTADATATTESPAAGTADATATAEPPAAEPAPLLRQWTLSEVAIDNAALLALESGIARSALPGDAPLLTPEFEEARKADIRAKSAAFNEAAFPYIQGREDVARTRLVEYRAAKEEELRQASEQAEAEQAAREEWANRCAEFIADGKTFSGEWTRDNRFGELSLHIARTMRHDNSLQFFGQLYDTKLPAASLDITGRCDLTQGGDKATVDITIYDGQYDPDQPTAEVYDSSDSLMVLTLSADGKLNGVMSCQSWKETPEKDFKVQLAPAKGKSGKK